MTRVAASPARATPHPARDLILGVGLPVSCFVLLRPVSDGLLGLPVPEEIAQPPAHYVFAGLVLVVFSLWVMRGHRLGRWAGPVAGTLGLCCLVCAIIAVDTGVLLVRVVPTWLRSAPLSPELDAGPDLLLMSCFFFLPALIAGAVFGINARRALRMAQPHFEHRQLVCLGLVALGAALPLGIILAW